MNLLRPAYNLTQHNIHTVKNNNTATTGVNANTNTSGGGGGTVTAPGGGGVIASFVAASTSGTTAMSNVMGNIFYFLVAGFHKYYHLLIVRH